jgi:hypothetical protein
VVVLGGHADDLGIGSCGLRRQQRVAGRRRSRTNSGGGFPRPSCSAEGEKG